MPRRNADAPRLIEWTGERIVPWAPDAQVIYEHYHRYLWAQPLVAGRRVLDLGSGEGFGAALLADTATAVVGVDIDERTVEHSRANYAAPNLEFRVGSATDLSEFEDGSFGAVVAFEMIEHVAEHERVLAEIARVLAAGRAPDHVDARARRVLGRPRLRQPVPRARADAGGVHGAAAAAASPRCRCSHRTRSPARASRR